MESPCEHDFSILDVDMRFDSPWDVIMDFYEPFFVDDHPMLDEFMLVDDSAEIGHIYRITNIIRRKVYIGKTTQEPTQRMQGHKTCCNHYKDHPDQYNVHGGDRSACYKLYNSMIKYGFENFKFEVLCSVPVNRLDETEKQYIKDYDSIKTGYNILEGGDGPGKFTPEIKAKMLASIKAAMPTTVDKIRKNEQSKNLPVGISWDNDLIGYRVRLIGLCNNKNFAVAKYSSQDEAKEAAKAFLDTLKASGVPYVSPKVKDKKKSEGGEALPRGINKVLNGYVACRQYKRIQYRYRFSDKAKTDEQKLERAKLFLKAADDALVRLHGAPRK